MKKYLALILTVVLMCSLFACGGKELEFDTAVAQVETTQEVTTEAETTVAPTTVAPTTKAPATEAPTEKPAQAVQVETKAPVVDNTPKVANVIGYWKHSQYGEHHTITITSQQGNTLNMTIQSVRGNGAQISDAFVTANMITTSSGAVGTFSYEDSFMNTGTGQITINSANSINLAINMTYNAGGGWGIMAASGDYIRG